MRCYELVSFLAILAVFATLGIATTKIFKMDDDNFIEEFCESQIEGRLGLPEGILDLTPSSKEKKEEEKSSK